MTPTLPDNLAATILAWAAIPNAPPLLVFGAHDPRACALAVRAALVEAGIGARWTADLDGPGIAITTPDPADAQEGGRLIAAMRRNRRPVVVLAATTLPVGDTWYHLAHRCISIHIPSL